MNQITEWSQGNPGAMTFLMELTNPENFKYSFLIFSILEDYESLRGTNLYVLWSDLCNKDIEKVYELCKKCPKNILEDACSRQDYSGRELVSKYFI